MDTYDEDDDEEFSETERRTMRHMAVLLTSACGLELALFGAAFGAVCGPAGSVNWLVGVLLGLEIGWGVMRATLRPVGIAIAGMYTATRMAWRWFYR